jgi:hypothetical protein
MSADINASQKRKFKGHAATNLTGRYSVPLPKCLAQQSQVGTPVILPTTFGGSPRALHQLYLDSMALVARCSPCGGRLQQG